MSEASREPSNLFVFDSVPEATPEFDISDPELVRMLEESQATHFWFRARNRRIVDFLRRDGMPPPARILEIGCGTGTVLSALSDAGYGMYGIEMHRELARRAAARNPSARIYSLDIQAPPPEFLRQAPFDAVALFDVVEHLSDPAGFLRACARFLSPGGRIVGTVPALQALWSDYDVFAGHQRRFSRPAIARLFREAGFSVLRASYFFQTLVPGMLVRRALIGRRKASDEARRRAAQHLALDPPGRFLNRALAVACEVERQLARFKPLGSVAGASLWFCALVESPEAFSAETRPRERTDDRS